MEPRSPPPLRVEVLLWGALALLGVAPALAQSGHIVGDGVDAFGSHWFYWWMRVCIEHLGDPSSTNLFFFPLGKSHFEHTGNNLVDATLSVPFQWIFGPTLYQPLFVVVLLLGNALTFRAFALELLGEGWGRFAATLLWCVNPYVLFELTAGRPTQAFLWFPPLVLLFFLKAAREPEQAWRHGAWMGVAMACTGWSYWFNAYFVGFALLVLVVPTWREAPRRELTLYGWALGAVLAGLLALPALLPMVEAAGVGAVPGLAAGPVDNNVAESLHGIGKMELEGAPLLLQPGWILGAGAALLARGWSVRGGRGRWIAAAVLLFVLGLGPSIEVGGTVVSSPLYALLREHLPFFRRLWFPYRTTAIVMLLLTPLLGAWIGSTRWPRSLLAGVVATTLAGTAASGTWPFNTHDARAPTLLVDAAQHGGAMIFLPFRVQHDAVMWQTELGVPMLGGMGESASALWPRGYKDLLGNGFLRGLRAAVTPGATRVEPLSHARTTLERMGYRWVVLRPSIFQAEIRRRAGAGEHLPTYGVATVAACEAVSGRIGTPPVGVDGDAVLWDLAGRYTAPAAHAWDPAKVDREIPWEGLRSRLEAHISAMGRGVTATPRRPKKRE